MEIQVRFQRYLLIYFAFAQKLKHLVSFLDDYFSTSFCHLEFLSVHCPSTLKVAVMMRIKRFGFDDAVKSKIVPAHRVARRHRWKWNHRTILGKVRSRCRKTKTRLDLSRLFHHRRSLLHSHLGHPLPSFQFLQAGLLLFCSHCRTTVF